MREGINGEAVGYCEVTEKLDGTGCVTVAARDGCVVDTDPLANILIPFIESWATERPPTGGQFASGDETTRVDVEVMTATAWLSQETGISVRSIRNITARVPASVELRDADALVTAIGRTEVFWDGTLTPRANEHAALAVRGNCCGGPGDLRSDVLTGVAEPDS